MMKPLCVSAFAVSGFLLLTNAAFASEEAPSAPPPGATPPSAEAPARQPAPAPPDPDDEVICKKEEPRMGSVLNRRKVCKTRRDWREEQHENAAKPQPEFEPTPAPTPKS